MSGFSPEWLRAQRWFRAKQRPVAGISEHDHASLGAGDLRVIEVAYADGGAPDRYLLPTIDGREPRDGDAAWAAFVRLMAGGAEVRADRGRFVFDATPALEDLLPSARDAAGALTERRLEVEQSNTSVVLGERLILKVYRLLEPGENPDLEVGAFLTDAGFRHTPALAGSAHYLPDGGEPCAAGMLQAFVPSTGDAWALMLALLGTDPAATLELAERIGTLTAELHAALGSRPDVPGFPARAATRDELAAWRQGAERQLHGALAAAPGRLDPFAPAIRARLDAMEHADGARVSRIHGDYHLGQLLATLDGGLVVIDFEGEPARALHERRQAASPLRDVAGMLRSLDYAARTAERGRHASGFDADAWLSQARSAFLGAYGAIGPDQEHLLAAFELEKACYEVRYEANNRPDWLWLPLAAIEQLVT